MLRLTFAVVILLSLALKPVGAQDFDKGFAAYQAGNYATALQEFGPLAEAGDVSAQTLLGNMYRKGEIGNPVRGSYSTRSAISSGRPS